MNKAANNMDDPVTRATDPGAGCWNEVGVAGDQSCASLAVHVHCRNCEVYAGAAQRNLQRPAGPGYREAWAAELRQPPRAADAADASALVFRIGREWLALPTGLFHSVAAPAPGHALPHRANGVLLGIVNVGGKLTASMSLAALLGIDEQHAPPLAGRHAFARLLVLEWEAHAFALPVPDLHGIVRYAQAAVQAPPATMNRGLAPFLAGVVKVGELQVGCLDPALVGAALARALR